MSSQCRKFISLSSYHSLKSHADGLKNLSKFIHNWDWITNYEMLDHLHGLRVVGRPATESQLSLEGTDDFDPYTPSEYCRARLSDFSHAVGVFTACVANNSRPIRICTRCLKHKHRLTKAYEVMKEKNHTLLGTDRTCIEVFHGKDSLGIVEDIHDNAVGAKSLWSKGACSSEYYSTSVFRNAYP